MNVTTRGSFVMFINEIRDQNCLVKRSQELVHPVVDPVWLVLVWEGVACFLDFHFQIHSLVV